MKNEQIIGVRFLHPRNFTTLTADVSPQLTGAEALHELQADDGMGAFISPPQSGEFYGLRLRRGDAVIDLTPNMTFAQAGVVDGDIIEIRLGGKGGGPTWSELGHMLFWSAAAASMFIKSVTPILVEFIKSKGSRSIIVQRGQDKVVITGHDPEKVNEVLKLLDRQPDKKLLGESQLNDHLNVPIEVTLLDSEKANSTES